MRIEGMMALTLYIHFVFNHEVTVFLKRAALTDSVFKPCRFIPEAARALTFDRTLGGQSRNER